MRRAYLAVSFSAVILLLSALVVRADDFWVKKQWQSWSPADVEKMLHDSPWSHKFGMVQSNLGAATRASDRGVSNAGNDNMEASNVYLNYYVEFRSAPPVREATVRDLQIRDKYDRMSPDQKKQFDERTTAYLGRDFKDYVLVHVIYECNVDTIGRELAQFWQHVPPDRAPNDTYLTLESGKQVPPLKFQSDPGGSYEFDLYFPRVVDGDPLLTPSSKEISLEFPHPRVTDFPAQRVFVVFKVDKMIVDGKLAY